MNAPRTSKRQATPRRIHLPCGCVVCKNWHRLALRNAVSDSGYRCNHCGDTVYLPHVHKKEKLSPVREKL